MSAPSASGSRPSSSHGTGTHTARASLKHCSAARYDGSSTSTRSPGSSISVAISVSACCEPFVINSSSACGREPARREPLGDERAQPRVALGRRVLQRPASASSARARSNAALSPATSNSSGAGRPPANEMTPGRSVSASSSRTGELAAPRIVGGARRCGWRAHGQLIVPGHATRSDPVATRKLEDFRGCQHRSRSPEPRSRSPVPAAASAARSPSASPPRARA